MFSTLGMAGLVYGFVRAASDGWTDALTLSSFVGGAVLLTAFVLTELRAEQPITPLRLFNDRSRTIANVARGLLFGGMFGLFFFLTQFLQDVLGYNALTTGFAFLPLPVTVFLVSQLTSRVLIHRVHAKVLMVGGVALGITGFALASGLDPSSSYGHVLASLLLFAVGNGLSFVPLTQAALEGVPAKDAGAASGLVNVTQQLGGTLGVAILVTVFGHFSRHASTSRASRRPCRRSTRSPWERRTPSWRRRCSSSRRSPWSPPLSGPRHRFLSPVSQGGPAAVTMVTTAGAARRAGGPWPGSRRSPSSTSGGGRSGW